MYYCYCCTIIVTIENCINIATVVLPIYYVLLLLFTLYIILLMLYLGTVH